METLASLVDNSLLVSLYESSAFQEDEEPRFTMLETIREYALERLASSGELEEVQRKHAQYYLTLAEATQPQISVRWDEADWWSKFTRRERERARQPASSAGLGRRKSGGGDGSSLGDWAVVVLDRAWLRE